jgi:hypothetical protein
LEIVQPCGDLMIVLETIYANALLHLLINQRALVVMICAFVILLIKSFGRMANQLVFLWADVLRTIGNVGAKNTNK